jgi:hypothetical protein
VFYFWQVEIFPLPLPQKEGLQYPPSHYSNTFNAGRAWLLKLKRAWFSQPEPSIASGLLKAIL